MPQLTELKQRLERIPTMRDLKQLSARLTSFRDRLTVSRAQVEEAIGGLKHATAVFPDEAFEKVKESAKRVGRRANGLHKQLTSFASNEELKDAITRKAAENAVTEIGEASDAARKALRERWTIVLSNQLASYRELVRVAQQFSLPGGTALQQVLHRIETQSGTPPSTADKAKGITTDLEALRGAVERLGLKGPAGRFLIQASRGGANPQDLFKNEVREFFDDRPQLWGLLKVCIK